MDRQKIHTDRQMDRQERQIDKQMDRQTHKQTGRQIHRYIDALWANEGMYNENTFEVVFTTTDSDNCCNTKALSKLLPSPITSAHLTNLFINLWTSCSVFASRKAFFSSWLLWSYALSPNPLETNTTLATTTKKIKEDPRWFWWLNYEYFKSDKLH